MWKPRIIVLFFILIFGCKSSFKSNYVDFSAYYNTFFNAKKSFKAGVKKSESQVRYYNTLIPLRVHETPLGAGSPDFQNAIDKGADILRKYEDSKWVDDALEIIGKSYFYKGEYFSADQKFDELYVSTDDPEMKQRAVFWKGRVLLELEVYNVGVQYLDEQLSLFEGDWRGKLEYQVQAVLAQHYIERENWVTALDLLNTSVNHLSKKTEKERGYFLIGQINEILGNPESAFTAYDRVQSFYTNYDLQFEAKKKKAEVARSLGKSDEAYKVFSSMVRDDKNTEFIGELNFELGKTEQDRGNYKAAERIYLRTLRNKRIKIKPVTKVRIYNGLAEIQRFDYNNFTHAAAYYDSAASINVKAEQLPSDFKAKDLASSFGEYANLKNMIAEEDSLLRLGLLSPEEFDSVLVVLEEQKRQELERLQKEQEDRQNTLVNVDARQPNNPNLVNESNGFLNFKNPVLISDASQQFRALWGNRPLLDNWRVSALIISSAQELDANGEISATEGSINENQISLSIDLSRIPFTPDEQDSVREEVSFLKYQLANLFFLSLELPDSASYYFETLLSERPDSKVAPVSLYSLSELYSIQDNSDRALSYANEVVNEYPSSVYASRLIEKYGIEAPEFEVDENISSMEEYFEISNNQSIGLHEKADNLVSFSLRNKSEKIASQSLFEAISIFIKLGKEDSVFSEKYVEWETEQSNWVKQSADFSSQQDSARIFLTDTLLTTQDSLNYVSILDSTLIEPNFDSLFPYEGVYWDSTRSKIELFTSEFNDPLYQKRIETLRAEFKEPVVATSSEIQEEEEEISQLDQDYLSCYDIDQEVYIRGGMNTFLSTVNIPDGTTDETITFLFYINQRGIIDEFKLVSGTENERLITAYVNAIDSFISFEPVLVNGVASAVRCDIEFEVRK